MVEDDAASPDPFVDTNWERSLQTLRDTILIDPEKTRAALKQHLVDINITARRHAFALLAMEVDRRLAETAPGSAAEPGDDLVLKIRTGDRCTDPVAVMPWFGSWLASLVVRGIERAGYGLGSEELDLPAVGRALEEMRTKKSSELARWEGDESDKAVNIVARCRRELAELAAPESAARHVVGWFRRAPIEDELIHFAAWCSGASARLVEALGMPLQALVNGLEGLAGGSDPNEAYWVLNLPGMLDRSVADGSLEADVRDSILERLGRLAQGREGESWADVRTKVCAEPELEPEALRELYLSWQAEPSEDAAIALARGCFEVLQPATRWAEMSEGERWALRVLRRVLLSPGEEYESWTRFTLRHRIRLTEEAIERWSTSNLELLVPLVDVLRELFEVELRQAGAGGRLLETCRRQVFSIQPLVAAWSLHGAINKDLGLICLGVLKACLGAPGDEAMRMSGYRELLYTILHALPERGVLRAMWRYVSTTEPVRRQLDLLSQMRRVQGEIREACYAQGRQDDAEADVDSEATRRADLHALGAIYRELVVDLFNGADALSSSPTPRADALLQAIGCLGVPFDRTRDDEEEKVDERSERPVFAELNPEDRRTLRWVLQIRESWRAEVAVMHSAATAQPGEAKTEKRDEIEAQTEDAVRRLDRVLNRVVVEERATHDTSDPAQAIAAMRRALEAIYELAEIVRQKLPLAEQIVVGAWLRYHIDRLEALLSSLTRVVENQDEGHARSRLELDQKKHGLEQRLIAHWMLSRNMLRELAPAGSTLSRLLQLRWVVPWVASPYVTVLLINLIVPGEARSSGLWWIEGAPFVAVVLANIALLVAVLTMRRDRIPGRLNTGYLLLPSMMGALFLGLMESLQADESWTLAFFGSPVIKGTSLAIFLLASVAFVRYALLHGQDPRPYEHRDTKGRVRQLTSRRILRERTRSIVAMGLWQSFLLVTIFSLLMGTVMAGPGRAELPPAPDDALSLGLGRLVPHMIVLSPEAPAPEPTMDRGAYELSITGGTVTATKGGLLIEGVNLVPVPEESSGTFRMLIFPWAILTWTVKLFFFSAIFQRIMSRYGD